MLSLSDGVDTLGGVRLSNAATLSLTPLAHQPHIPLRDVHYRFVSVRSRAVGRIDGRFPGLRSRLKTLVWVWLIGILAAAILVPSTRGLWNVWLVLQIYVLQLFVLSRSKTLRWRGVGLSFSCGFLVVAPLCAVLSTWLAHRGRSDIEAILYMSQIAPVTLAGPVEEILKLLPVFLVLLFAPTRARSLSVLDFTLLGLASGAGFEFAEEGARRIVSYGKSTSLAEALAPEGQHTASHGFFEFLGGVGASGHGAFFSGHAISTAIVATCIGLMWRSRHRVRWMWLPVVGLAVQIMDHALYNWSMTYGGSRELLGQFGTNTAVGKILDSSVKVQPPEWLFDVHQLLGSGAHSEGVLLTLVAVGLVVDYRSIAFSPTFRPLPGRAPFAGVMRWVAAWPAPNRVVRGSKLAVVDVLRAVLMILHELQFQFVAVARRRGLMTMYQLRQRRIDAFGQPLRPMRFVTGGMLVGAVLLVLPAVVMVTTGTGLGGEGHAAFFAPLFDKLGDWWNDLSLLEQLLITAAIVGVVMVATMTLGVGAATAFGTGMIVSSLATGVAEYGKGTATFLRNPQQATNNWFKEKGPLEIVLWVGAEVVQRVIKIPTDKVVNRLAKKSLDDLTPEETILKDAAPHVREKYADLTAEEILVARKARVEELAPDADHGFKVDAKSLGEAEIAEDLEFRGVFHEMRRPDAPDSGDFIDQNGVTWDIKGFWDAQPDKRGSFTEVDARKSLVKQIQINDRNVILDTRALTESNTTALRKIVQENSWTDNVIWYPPAEAK
jgi:RsiW-degrading membrane proteinase PrsW (M82 family)